MDVNRSRTAISRVEFSRPIKLALQDRLISPGVSVLDYGCGRGDDVRGLRNAQIDAWGWDPRDGTSPPSAPAGVVNLGYVVNVIEDASERALVLRRAWALAQSVLVVGARSFAECKGTPGQEFRDGFITALGTFQKYYDQRELHDWVMGTIGSQPIAAGPGVFYVFRDGQQQEEFLASRYRQRQHLHVRRSAVLYEQHQQLLEPLLSFVEDRGRIPVASELPNSHDVIATFGSIQRAVTIIRRVRDTSEWERIAETAARDLLVYLALSRFTRRPSFSQLPGALQRDTKAFFGSYRAATESADEMLFAAGDLRVIREESRKSAIGKDTPTALYVHRSALAMLSPFLRIYEGCATALIGTIEDANVIKLHHDEPAVSYLDYPNFENDPHPALAASAKVHLQSFRINIRSYRDRANPFILHRKEAFVAETHPLREKFVRLTRQEERHGLYEAPSQIGTREGWEQMLVARGVRLRGHRVIRS
jgi:DNA phosphorothioation-associated putative methyltransferase